MKLENKKNKAGINKKTVPYFAGSFFVGLEYLPWLGFPGLFFCY